jgi:hypothetical protein
MNGQAAQISTRTRVQYDFGPLSHSPPSTPTLASHAFTTPSGWSMVRQTEATTNDGNTYGMRNAARTRPRPRKAFWVTSAAATPIGTVTAVESTENDTLIQIEFSRPESSDSA